MRELLVLVGVGVVLMMSKAGFSAEGSKAGSALDFRVKDIQGREVDLGKYKGKVVLIVNTASKCGYTPQYADLQKVHETYKDRGLSILAFPANEFRNQEPGSNEEIREFCSTKYKTSFDLFSKIVVKGEGQAPLYAYLTSKQANPRFGGEIKWNFTKFLLSREGKVVGRFEPKVKPTDKEVVEAIEAELGK